MSEEETRCWKGVDVKRMMLNTIGDHRKEMSIKLCQTKPAFYTESKTRTHTHTHTHRQKRDRMRDRGSNKKRRWSEWRKLDSARVPQRLLDPPFYVSRYAMVSPFISSVCCCNYNCNHTNRRPIPQQVGFHIRHMRTDILCAFYMYSCALDRSMFPMLHN